MGIGYRRVWRDGQPWFVSSGWDNSPKLVVDETRGRLYEASPEYGIRAFNLETMELLLILPSPVDGNLVDYDSRTDQLYFFQYHPVTEPVSYPRKGQLVIWPASDLVAPSPKALQPAPSPSQARSQTGTCPAMGRRLLPLWSVGLRSAAGEEMQFVWRGGWVLLSWLGRWQDLAAAPKRT